MAHIGTHIGGVIDYP